MYLRTIYELQEEGITPMRARIAERLGQSGPTVSQTVARMERDGLVTVDQDRHLELTGTGEQQAVRVMRKHRRKDVLYCDSLESDKRKNCVVVLNIILECLLKWFAPILVFTTEEINNLISKKGSSIHETSFLKIQNSWNNISLNENLGNIKKGDVVFISYTSKDRFYFYGRNALHTGNTFLDVQTMSEGGEEINDAIRKFLLHIYESEEHGKLWYTQIIYTQSCIVPMLESMGIKVHEFYSFEPDSFDDMFLKLKELPIANNFITDECNKLSIDAGELLHTSGHFGNQETKLNLNKQWSDLFE